MPRHNWIMTSGRLRQRGAFPVGDAGFTLIEMVLVIMVTAILAAVGARGIAAGFESYLTAESLACNADRGRLAVERIMMELEGAAYQSLSQPDGSGSLQFTTSGGDTMLISASATAADTLVMQVNGGGEKILLQDLGSVVFTVGVDSVVTIELTVQKNLHDGATLSLPLKSAVYMGVP